MKYRVQRNFGKKGFDADVLRAMREAAEKGETPDAMKQFLGYKKKYAQEYSAYLNNNKSPKFTNKAAEDFYQKWKKEADDLLRKQKAQREAAARKSAQKAATSVAEESKDILKGRNINKKLIGGGLLATGALIRRKIKKDRAQREAQSETITE